MNRFGAEGHRLLVAAPENAVGDALTSVLRRAGYGILRATTGPEAISLFCVEAPPVVLIDWDLPGGGAPVCRDLLETDVAPDARVIFVVPPADREARETAFCSGAHDAVARDAGPEELLGRVAFALRAWAIAEDLRERNRELRRSVDRGVGELERVNRRLKQQIHRQQTVLELTQEMAASLEASQQANVLLLSTVGQLGALSATLWAGESEGEALALMAVKGCDREALQAIPEAERISWLAWMESPGASPVEGVVPAGLAALGLTLMVPIRYRARIMGAMVFGPKVTGQPYSAGDLRMLETMGNSFAIALQNAVLYRKLQHTYVCTIEALVSTIEAKDPYTRGHTARVARYAGALARELGLDDEQVQQVEYGAALHDVGKIGIFESLLNKRGDLTEEDLVMIRRHPIMGDRILGHIDFLKDARLAVRHHHERIDGGGYPDALAGEQIPLIARIVAVADAFDAMTTTRVYSDPLSLEEAIAHLEGKTGTQFCPVVVRAFVHLLRGGLVDLGRLAPAATA